MSFDVKTKLNQLKNSAKHRGIRVNLNIAKYQYLIDGGCYFCTADLTNEGGYCLDRIDNSKPYIITNVVACCKICNRAKSNMDPMDFIKWAIRLGDALKEEIQSINKLQNMGLTSGLFEEFKTQSINNIVKNQSKERIKVNEEDFI